MQNEVRKQFASGIAGDISRGANTYKLVESGVVGDANVCVGCFVKSKNDKEGLVFGASGVTFTPASERILGVVIRDHLVASCGLTNQLKEGGAVHFLIRGSIWVNAEASAKVGQYVFIKNDTGTLAFNDQNVLADHTYTGFVVSRSGDVAVDGNPTLIEITSQN